tara:strand:+ start:146 stop:856 length:711 start_codon:yes stop_codon:yes gene_type:complete
MFELTQYVWLIWSVLLFVLWVVLYVSLKDQNSKKKMLLVSLATSVMGLTEPIFVPEYWTPPSLFNLAATTGFDIESLLFSFGIGGVAVVIYDYFFAVRYHSVAISNRQHPRHRLHYWALVTAPAVFTVLYLVTDINPIYSTVIALTVGGFATWYCRPDLKVKMFISAIIFTILYYVYFLSLLLFFPEYVTEVWNLEALTGILVTGIPLEELLFAASFGFLWSSIYEHIMWQTSKTV